MPVRNLNEEGGALLRRSNKAKFCKDIEDERILPFRLIRNRDGIRPDDQPGGGRQVRCRIEYILLEKLIGMRLFVKGIEKLTEIGRVVSLTVVVIMAVLMDRAAVKLAAEKIGIRNHAAQQHDNGGEKL